MRSVISVDDIKDDELGRLFFRARSLKECFSRAKKFETAVMMTAFFEPSTRTRLSFEMAAFRLHMSVSHFSPASSSMQKGETVDYTTRNLLLLAPDILVIRQSEQLNLAMINSYQTAIINAGDGTCEHPSQALLDCFTLVNHFRSDDLQKKRILIIGDLVHSRVAHSNIKLMQRLGAEVILLAPDEFRLVKNPDNIRCVASFRECEGNFDAVMCLRIQKERLIMNTSFTDQDYFFNYGLTHERLARLGDACVVMHPGPMNVGVEIEVGIADSCASLIDMQVNNGVFMRAALIEHCLQ